MPIVNQTTHFLLFESPPGPTITINHTRKNPLKPIRWASQPIIKDMPLQHANKNPLRYQLHLPLLSLTGLSAVIAEASGIRLFSGDLSLLALPRRRKVVAVARLDLVARIPRAALVAVPFQQHVCTHLI